MFLNQNCIEGISNNSEITSFAAPREILIYTTPPTSALKHHWVFAVVSRGLLPRSFGFFEMPASSKNQVIRDSFE
jgi:hypothetical protein